MNKIILGILLSVTLLAACKKSGPHQTIDADIINKFNYMPGTYWIYRDSISGREDSFFVTSNSGLKSSNNNDTWVDNIEIYVSEYNNNHIGHNDSNTWIFSLLSNYLSLEWQNRFVYDPLFTYPFTVGKVISKDGLGGLSSIDYIYPIYSINGNTYNNVAQVNVIVPSLNVNDRFYTNTGIGIVKMKLEHLSDTINKIWELERWKIVK